MVVERLSSSTSASAGRDGCSMPLCPMEGGHAEQLARHCFGTLIGQARTLIRISLVNTGKLFISSTTSSGELSGKSDSLGSSIVYSTDQCGFQIEHLGYY